MELQAAGKVPAHDGGNGVGKGGGVRTIFLRRAQLGERLQTPRDGPQSQRVFLRAHPGDEGHARGELQQHRAVQPVVLAALHHGLRKVPHGTWVSHHQLHLLVRAQRQRQVQRVQSGRFQDHSHPLPPAGESAQQLPMARSSVGKFL